MIFGGSSDPPFFYAPAGRGMRIAMRVPLPPSTSILPRNAATRSRMPSRPSASAFDMSKADALGLLGMRERVAALRGNMDVDGGSGTRIAIRIPLPAGA